MNKFFVFLLSLTTGWGVVSAQPLKHVGLNDFSFNGIPFEGAINQDLDTAVYKNKQVGKDEWMNWMFFENFSVYVDSIGNYEIVNCNFNSNGSLTVRKQKLDSQSTLSDLKKIFPYGEYMDLGNGEQFFCYEVFLDHNKGSIQLPQTMRFEFTEGKLRRAYLHTMC